MIVIVVAVVSASEKLLLYFLLIILLLHLPLILLLNNLEIILLKRKDIKKVNPLPLNLSRIMPKFSSSTTKEDKTKTGIKFDYRRKVFVYNNNRLVRGLLPCLQKMLYPKYDWMKARIKQFKVIKQSQIQQYHQHQRQHQPTQNQTQTAQDLTQKQQEGMKRGNKLDYQIHRSILFSRQYDIPPVAFVNSIKRKQQGIPEGTREKLERMIGSFTDNTLHFWQMCVVKQLRPVCSQLTVGDVEANLATRVDVVCEDHMKNSVLIENKTGYTTYYHDACGPMQTPCTRRNDSPYHQHQMQLAMTVLLYLQTYPWRSTVSSFVWRYDHSGVTEYPLDDHAIEDATKLMQIIKAPKKLG